MKIKITILIILYLLLIPGIVNKVNAQSNCQPIYGGGETCSPTVKIVIDNKVLDPEKNILVDNLGVDDAKYQAGFLLNFQLSVTNNSNKTIKNIDILDTFPEFVTFTGGPGTFDLNTKTLSFTIDSLDAKKTKVFNIMGRIVNEKDLSSNINPICITNQVIAILNKEKQSQDSSQFCIRKEQVEAKADTFGQLLVISPKHMNITPATGANPLFFITSVPILLIGLYLRNAAKISKKI